MEPQGTQNHNKSRKVSTQKNTKNTALQKVGYCLHFGVQKGLVFRGRRAPKITAIPKIPKMGKRDRLEPPKLLKIVILTFQSLGNPCRNACFLHSCFQNILTICLQKSDANRDAKLQGYNAIYAINAM